MQRDCAAISGLVANWPGAYLNVRRILPREDFPLARGYLTKPVFVTTNSDSLDSMPNTVLKGPSLLDALIIGILSRQSSCALQVIDVSGFEEGEFAVHLLGISMWDFLNDTSLLIYVSRLVIWF